MTIAIYELGGGHGSREMIVTDGTPLLACAVMYTLRLERQHVMPLDGIAVFHWREGDPGKWGAGN